MVSHSITVAVSLKTVLILEIKGLISSGLEMYEFSSIYVTMEGGYNRHREKNNK